VQRLTCKYTTSAPSPPSPAIQCPGPANRIGSDRIAPPPDFHHQVLGTTQLGSRHPNTLPSIPGHPQVLATSSDRPSNREGRESVRIIRWPSEHPDAIELGLEVLVPLAVAMREKGEDRVAGG
jgi:hypothetical protein